MVQEGEKNCLGLPKVHTKKEVNRTLSLKKNQNIFCLNLIALPSLAEFPAVATATSVSFPAG